MKHFLSHRKVFDSYALMPTSFHICCFTIDGCNLACWTSVWWSSFTQRHYFISCNGNIVKWCWFPVGLMQIPVINIGSGLTYNNLCVRWEKGVRDKLFGLKITPYYANKKNIEKNGFKCLFWIRITSVRNVLDTNKTITTLPKYRHYFTKQKTSLTQL